MRNLDPEEEKTLQGWWPRIVETRTGTECHLPDLFEEHERTLCGKVWVSHGPWYPRSDERHLCLQCLRSARVAAWRL